MKKIKFAGMLFFIPGLFFLINSISLLAADGDLIVQNGSTSNSPNLYFGTETNPSSGKYLRLKDYWLTFHAHHHEGFKFELYNNDTNTTNTGVTISGNGNVGIGNTDPYATLDIINSGAAWATRGIRLLGPNIVANSGHSLMISVGKGDSIRNMGQMYFNYANDNSTSNRLSFGLHSVDDVLNILGTGNVGIGTTTPGSYKLNVAGSVRANEVVVNTTGADYVFEDSYKLKPLEEVEQYIEKEKHLPEIPSASEMKNNGVGVSEIQAKLLAKVEELTLYMIDQNKKLESVIKENEQLKSRVAELENEK
jgi:hypothetical protein